MKSYHYSLILLFSVVLFFSFVKTKNLKKGINELNKIVLNKTQSIEQLKFKLNNLNTVKTHFVLDSISNLQKNDTLMYYYFSDSVCMYCVNFELANNIKDTPIRVRANIVSDRKYRNLSRSYNQFMIQRDTSSILRLRQPFYILLIKNKVTEIFAPDIKKNNYTIDFLNKYGLGRQNTNIK